jgi:hypothetical protein
MIAPDKILLFCFANINKLGSEAVWEYKNQKMFTVGCGWAKRATATVVDLCKKNKF